MRKPRNTRKEATIPDKNTLPGKTGRSSVSRRGFIRKTLCTGAAVLYGGALSGFPYVHAKENIELRYVTGGMNFFQQVAEEAEKELGIKIILEKTDSVNQNMLRAVTSPKTMDLFDLDYAHVRSLTQMGMLKPVSADKLDFIDKLSPLFTLGVIGGKPLSRQGEAPFLTTFLSDPDSRGFSAKPTDWMSVVPTVFNADTLGVRPDLIDRPITNWYELLNPEFEGKVALVGSPGIGVLDAAMAVESMNKIKYRNKGDMSRFEIDKTIDILVKAKIRGQFKAFWTNHLDSVKLMASGDVVIQSMWSPAVIKLKQLGIPCAYLELAEGYRGWCYGIGLSRELTGKKLDAAYEFINWYHSGWVGAIMNRQGYYSSVPETAQQYLYPYEWAYWMEGKPAENDIRSPEGIIIDKKGSLRDGGSFVERISKIACWNSLMTESRYLLTKWQSFLDA